MVSMALTEKKKKEAWSYKATGDYQRSVFEPCFAIIVYVSFFIFFVGKHANDVELGKLVVLALNSVSRS